MRKQRDKDKKERRYRKNKNNHIDKRQPATTREGYKKIEREFVGARRMARWRPMVG